MLKDDAVYVGHMLDTARKATDKLRGKAKEDFDADENLRLALAHLIQIIGEAARRISRELQTVHPEIPWTAIVGMRHKVVHDYLNVDDEIVWHTITQELDPLIQSLERLLAEESQRGNGEG